MCCSSYLKISSNELLTIPEFYCPLMEKRYTKEVTSCHDCGDLILDLGNLLMWCSETGVELNIYKYSVLAFSERKD